MATIKQIDGKTIHQIQSGQVIVDLCSVAKELVENSIDAGATNIDVRFKNQGLDLIEVQDNGAGISTNNYAYVALKHHTSKLTTYSDISTLETFGFRGEALASLCALSNLTVTTCQAADVPKGTKLTFEVSGKLRDTSVVAAQRGTTVSVDTLFQNLPVRRRELERNIKREWHKVIALLNQYACIQTGLKFSVSQQPTKGKRILLFSTKGNLTTRDNIVNIFGAKTLADMLSLDLSLDLQPTASGSHLQQSSEQDQSSTTVWVRGHVSRPGHGGGRQTPDRQMFFVNGRPCGLPQFAKIFNEVYKVYNSHQSPFIFADVQLDTHLYDVNVSPDKRSIMLHEQGQLLDSLRTSLVELFDAQDYAVPKATPMLFRQTSSIETTSSRTNTPNLQQFKKHTTTETDSGNESHSDDDLPKEGDSLPDKSQADVPTEAQESSRRLKSPQRQRSSIQSWLRTEAVASSFAGDGNDSTSKVDTSQPTKRNGLGRSTDFIRASDMMQTEDTDKPLPVRDFNRRLAEGSSTGSLSTVRRKAEASKAGSEERSESDDEEEEEEEEEDEPPIPGVHPVKHSLKDVNLPRALPTKRPSREPMTVIIDGNRIDADPGDSPPSKRRRTRGSATAATFGGRLAGFLSADTAPGAPAVTADDTGGLSSPGEGLDEEVEDISDVDSADNELPKESVDHAASKIENGTSAELECIKTPNSPPPESRSAKSESELEERSINGGPTNRPGSRAAELHKDDSDSRVQHLTSGGRKKDTLQLTRLVATREDLIESLLQDYRSKSEEPQAAASHSAGLEQLDDPDAESKLSLIINKGDFQRMRVAGQFNLGFIIATRPGIPDQVARFEGADVIGASSDELFIIDQHASDEKYNFERLQESTVVQSQRLVHAKRLELTALEEEIVMENMTAIEANGFQIDVDNTGDYAVGSRCLLTALPLSRETTFSLRDLEELIALLGDEGSLSAAPPSLQTTKGKGNRDAQVPRPSKVRKMFAMRACRSSIMIGKALNRTQMYGVVRHMADLDKPWNCPHGRPTMRHLCRLDAWDGQLWDEDVNRGKTDRWQEFLG